MKLGLLAKVRGPNLLLGKFSNAYKRLKKAKQAGAELCQAQLSLG